MHHGSIAGCTPRFLPAVGGIGAASLLSDLGHEVPTALLPRFITSLGGSAAALGVIEGIADGLAGPPRRGALADDLARRRATAVGGYSSVAVLSGLIGAATSLWQVAVLRTHDLHRLGPEPSGEDLAVVGERRSREHRAWARANQGPVGEGGVHPC